MAQQLLYAPEAARGKDGGLGGVVHGVVFPPKLRNLGCGEQPRRRITLRGGCAATPAGRTSFAMPIASDAVVDALNATLATTKKAEASAMASQEEAGHVDAPYEWWDWR